MDSLLLLIVFFACGVVFRKFKKVSPEISVALGTLIIYLPLPALILLSVHKLHIELTTIQLVLAPWLVFLLSIVSINLIGSALKWSNDTIKCLQLTAGLGNTSFLGFPVVEMLYGKEAISFAAVIDQAGSFLALSTLGLIILRKPSSINTISWHQTFKNIISFPPFVSLLCAIILKPIDFTPTIENLLARIGSLLVPLAMLVVGLQFNLTATKSRLQHIGIGLSYKLIIAPLIIFCIFTLSPQDRTVFDKVMVIECSMPPMITASILVIDRNLDPELAGSMVSIGLLLSATTLTFWYLLMG